MTNEAQIRERMTAWFDALRAKDIVRMMAGYAPNVVVFDMRLPVRIAGVDAYAKQWGEGMPHIDGPVRVDVTDLDITAGDDVAFARCINRMTFMLGGREVKQSVRATICFRKIDGTWRVVHEHASVPIDMATGKGVNEF